MNGWETKTLGELCSKITDGTHLRPKYTETGIPFLSVKNLTQGVIDFGNTKFISEADHKSLTKRSKPEVQDILYTKVGTTGVAKVVDTDREFSIFVSIALLKLKHETIFNRYLEHFLNSKVGRDQARQRTRGMANKNLVIRDIKEIFVIYPTSLSEQKRIVAIVDQAFEGIDRAIANTKKNLVSAHELFESHLNAVFTQKGDGWVEKKLGDITELIDSLHKTPSYIDEGGFPMVRVTDIKDGVLNLNNARRVDETTFREFSKRHIPKIGDIVFSRVGSYGVPALVQSDEVFCLGQNTVFIVPQTNCQFLYFFLGSPNSQEQIEKFVAGTTQGTISLRSIKQIQVPIPPSSEQLNLAAKLSSVLIETQRLEAIYQQKLATLNELKQSILQKAFTGELTADTVNQTTKKAEEAIAA